MKESNGHKTVSWIEIPVTNFNRAKGFYSKLYNRELKSIEMGGNPYAFLPFAEDKEVPGAGAAITQWPGFKPSQEGSLIYLYAGNDLSEMLSRVEEAGGKISTPKAFVNDEIGYYATILDTEGNKIALHSIH
jgi:uncharacterized protein